MYPICKVMLFLSITLIIFPVIILLCNTWQKKYDKEHYDKNLYKLIVKFLLCGIGGLIVSGIFLLLHIY